MSTCPNNIKFYCAWFCPYAQRAWIALEHNKIPYDYVESLIVRKDQEGGDHGYDKNPRLLQINSKGLVPTLEIPASVVKKVEGGRAQAERKLAFTKIGDERDSDGPTVALSESLHCVEFLNSVGGLVSDEKISYQNMIPHASYTDDAEIVNKNVCSAFYKILMKPTREEQKEAFAFFAQNIEIFVDQITEGGYYKSQNLTIVDVSIIPWLLRLPLLKHYRPMFRMEDFISSKEKVQKLNSYIDRVSSLQAVKATLWNDHEKLIQAYRRYADGTATSQVGQAVRNGKDAHDI